MIQAPRGTFDILPESAAQRKVVEEQVERILGAAGYRRIETPTFEATDLFARGVGEATDIVQKEMFTFDDGGGRSVTLRPEGTAPIARRPRGARACVRAILVLIQVSSMKTRRSGLRFGWSSRHAARAAATSGRSC